MNNEGKKLIKPKFHPEVQTKPYSSIRKSCNSNLFNGKEIDKEARNYDLYSNEEKHFNSVFVMNTPYLHALKNKSMNLKSKSRPLTVKPFTGHKNRPSTSTEYVTSLVPGQKARPLPSLAQTTQKINEECEKCERMTLNFPEDPIAYFSKHKDGSGHLFIYLIHAKNRLDPEFNPYEIVKVPHNDITDEYFTMSANGVTHIKPKDDNETVTLEQWSFEAACFSEIRKLRFFKVFSQWKNFHVWKNFIQNVRFSEIRKSVVGMNVFSKNIFFRTSIDLFKTNCKQILLDYLLPFVPQKNYTIESFTNTVNYNREMLQTKFREYLNSITDLLHDLDADIRDPDRVSVKISDVDRNQKMFPDLGYLREAQVRVKEKKKELDKEVHGEVMDFSDFIRFTDYVVLESLQEFCYECWKQAERAVTSSMSSIFQVEVSFTKDGEIAFNPSIDELKFTIEAVLDQSLLILDNLPRLVRFKDFRPHLRERYGNIDELYEKGPTFKLCVDFNKEYEKIKKHIIKSVVDSYESARIHSQGFKEFFNLFSIGKVWDADDYIKKRGGESVKFDLIRFADDFDIETDDLTFDPSEEPYVDLRVIGDDLVKFKEEDAKISQFIACTVQGAIYIDSKSLRQCLIPIPVRSINAMKTSLIKLLKEKIKHISGIFRFCMKRLKREPENLKDFADNLEFNNLTKQISPYLETEICFIDDLTLLVSSFAFSTDSDTFTRSSLRSMQKQFFTDQTIAENISEQNRSHFSAELQGEIIQLSQEILRFQAAIKETPKKMKGIDIDEIIEKGEDLVKRIANIEPNVRELDREQKIININAYDFSKYDLVKEQAGLQLNVYDAVKQWIKIWTIITKEAFSSIDIHQFVKMAEDLDFTIDNLKRKYDTSLLNDVADKLATIFPYLTSMRKLSTKKMTFTHWNKLFEVCGHPKGYYAQIKLEEMLQMHIFENVDAIDRITETAEGENELNKRYNALFKHWREVKIPLDETKQVTEDTLMIGDIGPLLAEIDDGKIEIQQMLEGRFIQGVIQQVLSLGAMLENFSQVLEAWRVFQDNWVILNVFFAKEETRNTFPQHSAQFIAVRRRWMSLVHHASDNMTLFHICQFSSLLEMLKEINQSLISILDGVLQHIDIKRHLFPRLFFLSNVEVLKLFSTTDFDIFNKIISRLFMFVKKLEIHNLDSTETEAAKNSSEQTFNKIKIYGILGESDETLILSKTLVCNGGIETWGGPLIDMMKQSMLQSINDGIYKYKNSEETLWFETLPTYTMFIVYQIEFNRDIEECFDNFENNIRSFTDHYNYLSKKLMKLTDALGVEENRAHFSKIRIAITIIKYQLLVLKDICDAHPGTERRNIWNQVIRLHYKPQTGSLDVNFADKKWHYGFEFWGQVKPLVIFQHTRHVIENIMNAMCDNITPYVAGISGIGKKETISNIAMLFGKFISFIPGFQDKSGVTLLRAIAGGMESKCWVVLNRIQKYDRETLSLLASVIHNYRSKDDLPVHIEFGTYNVKLTHGFSLFLTGKDTSKIPSYLRKQMQPIYVNNPDITEMTRINLEATGFQKSEDLAQKLITCTKRITEIFDYIPSKSLLSTISDIISISSKILWESKRRNEDYTLSRAVYINFKMSAKESHIPSIIKTIFNIFRPIKSLDTFQEEIQSKTFESLDQRVSKILENDQTNDESSKSKLKDLLYNFFTKKCVVIYGPSSSGKSALLKEMVEAINKTEGETFTKVYSVHHAMTTIKGVFGNFEYNKEGHIYNKGLISTTIKSIIESSNQHSIIKFDGPLTEEFSNVLYEITSTSSNNRIVFLDQQKFSCDDVSIIVETDNIKNIAPNAALHTGFIPVINKPAETRNLTPIFERNACFNTLRHTEEEILKKEFVNSAPLIAMHVMKEQKQITKENESYIFSSLPEKALRYAFLYLNTQESENTETKIKYAILQSLYIVYAPLFTSYEALNFSKWICSNFDIKIPQDWAAFDVCKPYWNSFPVPSLASLVLNEKSFEPYNNEILKNVFYLRHYIEKLQTPDEIRVIQPSCVPLLHQLKYWMSIKQAIIISGPIECGKSCFIDCIFDQYKEIIPIIIPIELGSTQETIQAFIDKKICYIKGTGESSVEAPKVAFIFDNVDPSNIHVLEFIRSMFSKKKQSIINYHIFVTTRFDFGHFPTRFLSKFVPLSIPEQSIYTKKFIFQTIASYLNISNGYVKAATIFLEKFTGAMHYTRILDCVSLLPDKMQPIKDSSYKLIRVLLSELRFLISHKLVGEEFRKFSACFHSSFLDPSIQAIFQPIASGESLEMPEFEKGVLKYMPRVKELYKEELDFTLNLVTAPTELQKDVRFFSPVINNYLLLSRASCFPGGSCILKGKYGSGRKTLARFLSVAKEMKFYELLNQPLEKTKGELSELIKGVITKGEKILVFTRYEKLNKEQKIFLHNLRTLPNASEFFETKRYELMLNKMSESLKSLHQVDSEINQKLSENIYFCITIPEDYETSNITNVLPVLNLCPDPKSFAEKCIKELFEQPSLRVAISTDKDNISNAMIEIFSIISPSVPFALFFDFVKYFETIFVTEYAESDKIFKLSREAVDFVTIVKKEAQLLDNKISALDINEDGGMKYFDEKKNHIEARRVSIMNRLAKINSEENQKRQEIFEIEDDLEKLKTATVGSVRNAAMAMNKLSEKPQKLNSFYGNRAFVLLFELLSFFCGDLPKFEPYGRILAEDQELKATLSNKATVRELSPNEEKIAQQVEKMYEDFAQLSPYVTNLADYALEMVSTARMQKELGLKEDQLKKDKKVLSQVLDNFKIERDSIEELLNEIKEEFDKIDVEVEAFKEKNKAFEEIVNKRKGMEELMLRIDDLSQRWFEFSSKHQNSVTKATRNSLLLSFFLAYGGTQFEILGDVEEIMRKHEIYTGSKSALEIIGEILGTLDAEKDQLLSDSSTSLKHIVFLQLALHSERVPLIADDDGFILESIKRIVPKPEQMICSIKSSFVTKRVIETAEKGMTMIITDVDELTPQLERFISLSRSIDVKKPFLIDNVQVIVDPSFKLILIAGKHIPNIGMDLISKVNPIDFNKYNQGYIRESIEKTFVVCYKPQAVLDIMDPMRSLVEERVQMKKVEKELLEIISDIRIAQKADKNYVFADDYESMTALLQSKSQFLSLLINTQGDKGNDQGKRDYLLKEYIDPIDITESIWNSLSKAVTKVSPLFAFSFVRFIKIIEGILKENKNISKLKEEIVKKMEETILPSLTIGDGIFFMLLTAFFYSCKHGLSNELDLVTIAHHIQSEYSSKCKRANLDESRGETFEQLKFINFLDIYKLCEILIRDNFDEHFYRAFKYDCIPQEENIIFIKHNGITLENFEETLGDHMTFTLWPSAELFNRVKTSINRARKVGGIVVLYYDLPNEKVANFIIDYVDILTQSPPKKGFKLIVSCGTTEFIPKSILLNSKVIQTKESLSVYHTINNFRSIVESSPDLYLGYSVCIFFVLSIFRGFVKPNGITNSSYITERIIRKMLNKINSNKYTLAEAKSAIQSMLECSFKDQSDARKCIAHLKSIIKPEITNDIFSFSRSIESPKWIIPKKAESCNKIIDELPILPPIDTLGVERHIWSYYMQWSLSRWIADPFIKLVSDNKIDADAKIYSIAVTLQNTMQITDSIPNTPLSIVIAKEIDIYNHAIEVVKETVRNPSQELKVSIYNDICPKEWADAIHINASILTTTFFRALLARKEFISAIMQNTLPNPLTTLSCSDVKKLIHCYMNEFYPGAITDPVFEMEISRGEVKMPLAIEGVSLIGWSFDSKNKTLMKPNKDARPSTKLSTIYLKPKQSIENAVLIPLYSSQSQESETEMEREPPHFICNIAIKGNLSKKELLINGVCAVLHQSISLEE